MANSFVDLDFELGFVQGRTMDMEVHVNGYQVYSGTNIYQKQLRLEFSMALPGLIEIKLSGKNEFDTEIDDRGNIVADKYIKLRRLIVDKMPVKTWLLENKLVVIETDNNIFKTTNYFGYNGTAIINIKQDNSLDFHLAQLTAT